MVYGVKKPIMNSFDDLKRKKSNFKKIFPGFKKKTIQLSRLIDKPGYVHLPAGVCASSMGMMLSSPFPACSFLLCSSRLVLGFSPAVTVSHGVPSHPGGRSLHPTSIPSDCLRHRLGVSTRARYSNPLSASVLNRIMFPSFSTRTRLFRFSDLPRGLRSGSGDGSIWWSSHPFWVRYNSYLFLSSQCLSPALFLERIAYPDSFFRETVPTFGRPFHRVTAALLTGLRVSVTISSFVIDETFLARCLSTAHVLNLDWINDVGRPISCRRLHDCWSAADSRRKKLGHPVVLLGYGPMNIQLMWFKCLLGLLTQIQILSTIAGLLTSSKMYWASVLVWVVASPLLILLNCNSDILKEVDRGRRPVYIETYL